METDPDLTQPRTVTESGKPVARRIATAEAAYNVFQSHYDADMIDATRRATIQGMIDGNPPYVQAELDEAGLGNIINVNFMSMRANLDTRASAAHELFMEVSTLIEISPRHPGAVPRDQAHLLGVIAEEFSNTVKDWTGFLSNMDLVFRESDAYGIGIMLFEDEYTWRPKAYKRGSVPLDSMASIDLEDNDVYTVRDAITAGALFDAIKDPKVAREEGWNVTGVELTLKDVFLKGDNGDQSDKFQRSILETLQQMSRNCDPDFQQRQFERVKVVHVLCREVSGDRRVSHMIIPESPTNKLFLYNKPDRFATMSQVMWWLPYNYGDGYAKSVRGVGSWMAQHDDLSNRYLCRIFDAGFMVSSLLLQPVTGMDLSRLQFVQHGPYTIIPPELKMQQTNFQPQLMPLIQLREVGENVMKNNTGMYRQYQETTDNVLQPKTARQVAEESSKEARLEKAQVAHRYVHYERLYREIFRRMIECAQLPDEIRCNGRIEAREFMRRCLARGVPSDLFQDHKDKLLVTATQAIGMGSLSARMDITNQVLSMAGALDAEGQVNATRERLAVLVGWRNVDKFRPPVSRDQVPSNDTSIAMLENNDLAQGQQASAGSEQLHRIHIAVHSQLVMPILQALQQNQIQDPQAALTALSSANPHLREHQQFMASNPLTAAEAKQLDPFLRAAEQAARTLQADVDAIRRQQEREQQDNAQRVADADQVLKDRELEAKIYEIQRKAELERMKQESLNSMRAEKTAAQLDIARAKAQADMALARDRQAAELDIQRQKGVATPVPGGA